MIKLDLKIGLEQKLKKMAAFLAEGKVIVYPTETVYGLGCDATNKEAIGKIYWIKERDESKQLLVLVGSRAMSEKYFEFDKLSRRLAKKYWPGALTLILPVRPEFRQVFGYDKVGVRLSSNPVATSLSRRLGRPITSTSVNLSGQPAALTSAQVLSYFADKLDSIAALADSGELEFSPGSTIIDMTVSPAKIVRQGRVEVSEKLLAMQA
ncbi:threonylcarbamoyl-AMP synthase [Candidatus Falkowbacteria bacterium]|nr:threonylcarbamoyl-AMP synthase [Candidatus Falkowbacteria bacterium]